MPVVLSAQDSNAIIVVAEMISRGKLVVIPTDSGYGLATALSDESILKLYLAKNRTPDKTTPLLISSLEDLSMVSQQLLPPERRVAERFWPGPLTLLLPKADGLPQRISKLPTVPVRLPDHKVAQAVVKACGGALAVIKATVTNQASARNPLEALQLFGDSIAAVLDVGEYTDEVSSTVAEINGRHLRIVRPGPISEEELRTVLDE